MWIHFESFHITQIPTYMSMYFPAQGLLLAVGKVLAGHPWFGVWVSNAVMCAAFVWMLQAWLPVTWALLGGILAILRIALFSYWIDQYWGGAIPALAGALVLGAVPRIVRRQRARDFFWMALGISLLGLSRPYEGLLVSVPSIVYVGWKLRKTCRISPFVLARRTGPASAILMLAAAFLAHYNHRLFGNILTTPYHANRVTYASAPHFLWQTAKQEPVYRHPVMQEFYSDWELSSFDAQRVPLGFLKQAVRKLSIAVLFYFGAPLLIPFVMLPRVLRDRRIRFLVITGAVFMIGLFAETWLLPHYVAPFAAGVYAVLLQSMRHLRAAGRRDPSPSLFLFRMVPAVCIFLAAVRLLAPTIGIQLPGPQPFTAYGTDSLGLARATVAAELEQRAGGQLAIVRYGRNHDIFNEWVYNTADIDHSKIVWARDMNAERNTELLHYFNHRTAWLIEPDFTPARISLYTTDQQGAPLKSNSDVYRGVHAYINAP
jgi:hypothetical protein